MKFLFLISALFLTPGPSTEGLQGTFGHIVDETGGIVLPENFRLDYVHLGSWFVPEGDASGFHDVYTQREAAESFRKTGQWPDGAVLVKELRGHQSKAMTTGTPAWATETLKQWFVMVKDAKGRFKTSKNWGDGWGWALFQPGKTGNVSTDYKTDCLGCHAPARNTDWIYVEGYPTLSKPGN